MTIYTATRGEVVGAPVQVTADTADGVDTGGMAVLVLRDIRPSGQPRPGEPVEQVEPAVEYQVCLREPTLSRQVLHKVQLGDRLVVLGTLQLDVVTGPLEDSLSAARISLDAVVVGLDLGSHLD